MEEKGDVPYGGLNKCSWPTGSGTIRRCGLVAVGVAYWMKCVTAEAGFEAS